MKFLIWITNNLSTIFITLILLIIIGLIIRNQIIKHKKGKTICGCDCKYCSMSSNCHKRIKKT